MSQLDLKANNQSLYSFYQTKPDFFLHFAILLFFFLKEEHVPFLKKIFFI